MISPSQLPHLAPKTSRPDGAPRARRPSRTPMRPAADVAIRVARTQDATTLHQLEELDGRTLTTGARLVAELDGIPVAAIAVDDGTVVADPFTPTSGVVDLLRVRARQMRMAA